MGLALDTCHSCDHQILFSIFLPSFSAADYGPCQTLLGVSRHCCDELRTKFRAQEMGWSDMLLWMPSTPLSFLVTTRILCSFFCRNLVPRITGRATRSSAPLDTVVTNSGPNSVPKKWGRARLVWVPLAGFRLFLFMFLPIRKSVAICVRNTQTTIVHSGCVCVEQSGPKESAIVSCDSIKRRTSTGTVKGGCVCARRQPNMASHGPCLRQRLLDLATTVPRSTRPSYAPGRWSQSKHCW